MYSSKHKYLCEADEGKLATTRSRTSQLLPHFSNASHASKIFVFLSAFLLKVKKFQRFVGKLVVRPEEDSSDLCKVDGG